MYRSRFTDDAGREHVIITTHFEATDARRDFPCWDEPDLKATFAVTLVVPEDLIALTNTPEIEREPADPGFARVRFAPRCVMSTYLVCVVVGPSGPHGAVVRGADARSGSPADPDRLHLAGYATRSGSFALDWFGDYYAIPYPEQKLDQVAIPDFAQGAMENTGLRHLPRDAAAAGSRAGHPRRAAGRRRDDRARERAHVVRRPRDDALVERHLAERGVRDVHVLPLRRRDGAVLARCSMRSDDPHRRRSRWTPRDDAADRVPGRVARRGERMFDILTYTKGGAVLRMIEQWLGPECSVTGSDDTSRRTRTRTPRRTTCGTPSRPRAGSRSAGSWTPGSSSRATRRSRSQLDGDAIRLTQQRFAPSLPRRRDHLAGAARSSARSLPTASVRASCSWRRMGSTVPLAHPEAMVVANAGCDGVRADLLRRRAAGRASRARPARPLAAAERQSLVDDAWATVVAGRASVVVVSRPRGRVRRGDVAVGLADDHRRARLVSTGSSTARRASGSARTSATLVRARPSSASAGMPRDGGAASSIASSAAI